MLKRPDKLVYKRPDGAAARRERSRAMAVQHGDARYWHKVAAKQGEVYSPKRKPLGRG